MAEDRSRNDEPATVLPPRASIPSGDNSVWADVSPLLQAASQDLQEGELIHGDNFNLFAAMSALEIMDPKMDSGMACAYYSVEDAIESGAAPVPISDDKSTDVRCTIDIMDHLLACEATWHKGHSLAQTVYSCLYLLRPERTSSHALLHSYCKVIRATCKAVLSVVSDARTHEEEDLFTMAYGLPLNGDGDEKCLSLLNAVEETISHQLRACKASSSKRRVSEDIEPLQNNPDLEEGYCKALLCRLRFRKHFYHLLMSMKRPLGRGLELARKHIASCISEIDHIRKSSEFLRVSPHGISEENVVSTTASGCQPIGFDGSLNCTPPRAIEFLCWEKALEYFMKLLQDLDIICSYSLEPSLEAALLFVVKFQKSQPDLVSRAHLQLLLVQDGKLYGRDPMFSMITRAAGLPEVTETHDIRKNEFMVQLGQLVINLLKILCTNTAWQRRKLGKMLQDWRVTYVQLEMAFKKEIEEAPKTSNNKEMFFKIYQHILLWVEEQTYWIALRFLNLGFELDLYSVHDYCMVYWYIYAVLIKLVEKKHLRMAISRDAAKKKAKKKKDSFKDAERDYRIPAAVLFLQSQMYLAEGLSMMFAALRNECRIVPLQSPFNTEQEIFIQQFDLLLKACVPDRISYKSFKESTTHANFSTLAICEYFKEAQRIAKEVKSSFANDPDSMAELCRVEQVAERNSIAFNVCRVGALDPKLKISFTFCHHPFFATAIVKRS